MRRTVGALLVLAACGKPATRESVRVTVPRGAGFTAVSESLQVHGVIGSTRWFRLYARLRGLDRSIQAGVYDLPRGLATPDVFRMLASGSTALERLVIPEGSMLTELAGAVETQLGIPADSVLVAARDAALLDRVGAGAATLEGYLYPSTYHVRVGVSATEVVRQMLAEFEARWRPAWDARADTLGLTRHDIVILASIIEGEVLHDRDRPFVSSVYHNRLRAGWRLQADPTVIYALGRRRRLFQKDYALASPYNTYQIDGLPPGPIGAASAASLAAALYPARTNFFYFVARADGHHVFSRTLREHNAAIARIRGASER
ncbi:MAG TPA: endolytic transglycosylase MltG [Gemmatimonadales bacterium]